MLSFGAPIKVLGSCVGGLDWSATGAASGQSQLAGVLAGFVFGGIVVLLSVRADRSEEPAKALKLLFCAFFGLAVVAYLLADQAGDSNCLRASSEEILSGGILGTFAIIMIVSLTWLVVAYNAHANGVLRFLRHLVFFASTFVVVLLCMSSYGYIQAEVPHGPPVAILVLICFIGVMFCLAVLPPGSRIISSLAVRIRCMTRSVDCGSKVVSDDNHRERRSPIYRCARAALVFLVAAVRADAIDRCAWMALGYLVVAAGADAVVLSLSDSVWGHPLIFAAYVVAGSLLLPLIVLIFALRALAPREEAPGNEGHDPADRVPDPRKEAELPAIAGQNLADHRSET